MRLGEFCVGNEFNTATCWTRAVIHSIAYKVTQWRPSQAEVALIKPPPRKMPAVSAVLRQASTQPLVVDLRSREKYALAIWSQRVMEHDPLAPQKTLR